MQSNTLTEQIQNIFAFISTNGSLQNNLKNSTPNQRHENVNNGNYQESKTAQKEHTNQVQIPPIVKIILNSLKINQKLHNSILQKESHIQQQAKSFLTQSLQTEHKLQQTLKKTKELYEETIHQNQKSKFLLQQFISPIRQQLKSKVDQTTFSLQMKMLLDQYDNMGHQITYDMTEQQKLKEEKKKSIQSETLIFLKQKILPILSELQIKFQSFEQKNQQFQNHLQNLQSKTLSLQSQLNLQQQKNYQNQLKIMEKIDQKIDMKQVEIKINEIFKTLIDENSRNFLHQISKLTQFSKNIKVDFEKQIQNLKSQVKQNSAKLKYTENLVVTEIQRNKEQIIKQEQIISKINNQINNIQNQLKKYDNNVQFINKFHQKFQELQNKVENGNFQTKSQLKKEEMQNFIQKLHEFQIESKKLKKFQKQNQQKNLILKGQLQGIRDLLAKKANFTDILMHMENKVDKKEFKDLKGQLEDLKELRTSYDSHGQQMRNSQRSVSSKRKNLKNRSFFSPSVIEKQNQSTQLQTQQVKRFKLGFNSQFFIPPNENKKHSKTFYLRQSIRDNNNSNIFKQITQQD